MDPGKRPAPEPPAQPPHQAPQLQQQQYQQQQPVHVIQNPAPVVQLQIQPDPAVAPVPAARVAPPPPLPLPPPPPPQQQQQQVYHQQVYQPPSPPPFNVASIVPTDGTQNGHSSHHRSSPSQSLQRKRQSAAKVAHQFKARIAEKQAMLKHQAEEMRDKMLEEAGGGAGTGLSNGQAQEQNVDLVIGADESDSGIGICGWLLTMISWGIVAITLPFSLFVCFKVVQEYERAVIFRLGRLLSGGSRGPGIFFVLPCIESYQKVDLRTITLGVPPQEVLTKDSVTVSVDAVVYYRVSNATVSVANVENAHHSTRLLAQTTLRNILGTKNLHEILSDRESISGSMQTALDEATTAWGIKVERVEIKDARLPVQLQRAMAAEAEAAREARAKVIAAEGEQKASRALKEASEVIAESSSALQLRYLQTLNSISAEKNSTIIFPLPIDFITHFMKEPKGEKGEKED